MEEDMTYEDAKKYIHVRSAMFRTSNPNVKFWKNSSGFAHIDSATSVEEKAATCSFNCFKKYHRYSDHYP